MSEIIHGKSREEAIVLLKEAKEFLRENGKVKSSIIVNELIPGTPLSRLFDIQMHLHTKGGRIYESKETSEMLKEIGLREIRVARFTPYHYVVRGTL